MKKYFLILILTILSISVKAQGYTYSAPLVYNNSSNLTIRGDSINGGNTMCIHLTNCTNIRITHCKLQNSTDRGIRIDGTSSNITVDSCFFGNLSDGVYVFGTGGGIVIRQNEFLNMIGPFTIGKGHSVQFNNVNGAGCRVDSNKCLTINGAGTNPTPQVGDVLNLYQSNGTSGSPIHMWGNWIRGGGTLTGSLGAAGIVIGDVGGSYQDCEYNIVIDAGYVGIQQQGGSNCVIQNNTILMNKRPWSGGGLIAGNFSGTPSTNNTITNNTVYCYGGVSNVNGRRDTSWKPGTGSNTFARPIGWDSNTISTNIPFLIIPINFISPANIPKNGTTVIRNVKTH